MKKQLTYLEAALIAKRAADAAAWAALTPRQQAAHRGHWTRAQRAADLAHAVRVGWTANGYAR